MSSIIRSLRAVAIASLVTVAAGASSSAQGASAANPAPGRPPVCAKGVRVFTDKSQVPTPYDTLRVPPPDAPIRVTSPEEAEAAELALRARAGSVGATGVLVTDEVTEDGGMQRMRRSVQGLFVRADSARAQQACK
ncbi:MAG: hypothetical protein V4550_17770 [Gemmatimonadota bacterium]